MRQELYNVLRERIARIIPELQEKHLFVNGFCRKCGVDRIWQERTPRDQMTGEVEYGTDPLKADGVMIEVTKHDETDAKCYRGSRDIQLADVLRAIEINLPCVLGDKWVDMASDGWMFLMFKNGDGHKTFRSNAKWELQLALHEQSDELGEWLTTIIK